MRKSQRPLSGERVLTSIDDAQGRPVEIYAYADRILIRQDGRVVGEHPRCYSRGATIYESRSSRPISATSKKIWRKSERMSVTCVPMASKILGPC